MFALPVPPKTNPGRCCRRGYAVPGISWQFQKFPLEILLPVFALPEAVGPLAEHWRLSGEAAVGGNYFVDIDYYFFYGPEFDKNNFRLPQPHRTGANVRQVGLRLLAVQNRYKSQEEILGIARKYRELHIPADNIVQDWFWWNRRANIFSTVIIPTRKAWWISFTARIST